MFQRQLLYAPLVCKLVLKKLNYQANTCCWPVTPNSQRGDRSREKRRHLKRKDFQGVPGIPTHVYDPKVGATLPPGGGMIGSSLFPMSPALLSLHLFLSPLSSLALSFSSRLSVRAGAGETRSRRVRQRETVSLHLVRRAEWH